MLDFPSHKKLIYILCNTASLIFIIIFLHNRKKRYTLHLVLANTTVSNPLYPKNVAVSLHRMTQGTGTLPSLFFNNSKINQRNCYCEMDILVILYQYNCYVVVSCIEKARHNKRIVLYFQNLWGSRYYLMHLILFLFLIILTVLGLKGGVKKSSETKCLNFDATLGRILS